MIASTKTSTILAIALLSLALSASANATNRAMPCRLQTDIRYSWTGLHTFATVADIPITKWMSVTADIYADKVLGNQNIARLDLDLLFLKLGLGPAMGFGVKETKGNPLGIGASIMGGWHVKHYFETAVSYTVLFSGGNHFPIWTSGRFKLWFDMGSSLIRVRLFVNGPSYCFFDYYYDPDITDGPLSFPLGIELHVKDVYKGSGFKLGYQAASFIRDLQGLDKTVYKYGQLTLWSFEVQKVWLTLLYRIDSHFTVGLINGVDFPRIYKNLNGYDLPSKPSYSFGFNGYYTF